ncbi:hypothetical protein V2S66_29875 [Streptomyces sp. V4-01]|uniref:Uncharacterized protein n=1 Tax=Actinacidiphila polyblastidii TaxID=3110430 RepID=A0ABU7PKE5_9ACTN|nr:hypothetical protein [Streptomyces sp. V4-01]
MIGHLTPARAARGAARRPARFAAWIAALAVTVAAGLALQTAPASATALPLGQCTTSSGVILAVDFSHWGGPLLRSCGTTPTTGYALLNQGGWATTGTQHDGPAFICRIGYGGYQGGKQYPASAQEHCVLTPPATAYWSYWHAAPGQNSWSYSQLGAMSYHPEPGSVDLWTFGATNTTGTQGRPTFSPDTVRARNTAPTGGSSGGSGGTGTSGGGSGGGSGTSGGGSGGGTPARHTTAPARPAHATTAPATPGRPRASTPASPSATSPSATVPSGAPSTGSGAPEGGATPTPSCTPSTAPGSSAPATATASATPATPCALDAEPTAAAGHSTGSAVPFAITAGVVAVAGAGIALRVRRRRHGAGRP